MNFQEHGLEHNVFIYTSSARTQWYIGGQVILAGYNGDIFGKDSSIHSHRPNCDLLHHKYQHWCKVRSAAARTVKKCRIMLIAYAVQAVRARSISSTALSSLVSSRVSPFFSSVLSYHTSISLTDLWQQYKTDHVQFSSSESEISSC